MPQNAKNILEFGEIIYVSMIYVLRLLRFWPQTQQLGAVLFG